MNLTLSTMRTFKTKNFTVVARAVEDPDVDLSFDEDGSIQEQLEKGDLTAFGVIVTVYYKGQEVGEDSLWSCIYRNYDEFMDHKECGKQNREWAEQGKEVRCGSYFKDMIHEAIAQARQTLSDRPYIRTK